MEKILYKYEVSERGETMMGSAELTEIMARIGRQMQIIHARLRKQCPEAAAEFRAGMAVIVMSPASPVWEDTEQITEGIDFFHVSEQNTRGGVNHEGHLQKAG